MAINISNILTQLNTKMSSDSSANTTELLRRVQAYNSLNNIKTIEYKYYSDLPPIDSSNIGQLAYVRASADDSFGTFFFSKALLNDSGTYDALDSTNSGWQKIVLNANDSDNFADIVAAAAAYSFQGSTSGFLAGGVASNSNVIDTFSLVSDANATDYGDLTTTRGYTAGATSSTHGYTHGGGVAPPNVMEDTIDKFPFSASANATDVGNLTANRGMLTGQSSSTYGYSSGGMLSEVQKNEIEKYSFSADGNATDVGDLTQARRAGAGTNSSDNGYMMGGWAGANVVTIDKFPFSSDASATDVGDTIAGTGWASGGQSSTTHGYVTGNVPNGNVIQKMPFSVDANTTDVGDLTAGRNYITGVSSTTYGYAVGGAPSTVIDKFPFSSDANATDVGDITVARGAGGGTQV